jgi:hypothetical protein
MSSTNLVAHALVLAGLVGALSLPNTARAQSVTPERALLNRLPAIPSGPATAFTSVQAPAAAQPAVIDGERALLNRSQTIILQPVEWATPVVADASVDGVKALLNRSSS